MLFMYCYISAVTAFCLVCSIRIYRHYITLKPQQRTENTKYIKKEVREIRKEVRRLQIENKEIRNNVCDEIVEELKAASRDGEVTYFSIEDIDRIIAELKKE